MDRRKFINLSGLGITSFSIPNFIQSSNSSNNIQPIVASTWDAGLRANVAAWDVLKNGGKALDAVEQGVMVTENELNCCVGLAVLLGYFAWHTYQQISKKNDEDYQRLVKKNEELEEEVANLREEMMALIVEERNRMADLVKANTEALTELRRTITDYMLRA